MYRIMDGDGYYTENNGLTVYFTEQTIYSVQIIKIICVKLKRRLCGDPHR